jgi:hypothetical protein
MDSDDLRAALDDLALGGATWQVLIARVAMATGRRVRLVAADGALLVDALAPPQAGDAPPPASSPPHDRFDVPRLNVVTAVDMERVFAAGDPVDIDCTDGMAARAIAVVAGERRVGAIAIGQPAHDLDGHLRATTTAVAIAAVRRDAQAAAVAESAGWLIDELRFGSTRPTDDLERVALRYGLHLDAPHAVVALDYDGPDLHTWATSLSWVEAPLRAEGRRAWSVVAGDVAREIDWIQRRLQPFVRGRVRVAAGAVVTGAHATRESAALADAALELLLGREARATITFDELGLTGLLLTVPEAHLTAFQRRSLGPLLDRPDLLATLEAWYASSGSRAQVAEAVSIHRNSVGHRIERIRALLGADPDAPEVARDLRAALAAREILLARARSRTHAPSGEGIAPSGVQFRHQNEAMAPPDDEAGVLGAQ